MKNIKISQKVRYGNGEGEYLLQIRLGSGANREDTVIDQNGVKYVVINIAPPTPMVGQDQNMWVREIKSQK